MNTEITNVTNYLVPAAGTSHAVKVSGDFTATPYTIQWRQFSIDNFPFQPQGVFIDNTQGSGPLTITIVPMDYNVVCPAGASIQAQFPAPNGQNAVITGDGTASCIFVDFPVLPTGTEVTLKGTPNVTISGATNQASPVYVAVPINSDGSPYSVSVVKPPAMAANVHLASATSASVPVPGQGNLVGASLYISANATLAAAGQTPVSVVCNGTTVFTANVYFPAAPSANGSFIPIDLHGVQFPGGVGTLVLNIGTALNAGSIDLNAYFE